MVTKFGQFKKLKCRERSGKQGSGGYTSRIRMLYNKDHEVMFSDTIIEPLKKTFAYKGCKITPQKKVFFLVSL